MTRGLFLLCQAMNHFGNRFGGFTMPFRNIGQINQGMAQRVFTNYVCKVCCLYAYFNGGNTGATHVLTAFQLNPFTVPTGQQGVCLRLDSAQRWVTEYSGL